jgi:hypothetical protein
MIERVKIGNNGYIILADNNGTILADPKNKIYFQKYKGTKYSELNTSYENGNSLKLSWKMAKIIL